jgi:molybdenum cofactor synthesis domain-containing protein
MKVIKVEDAVGQILCHDMTQIIPGKVKDAVFKKGHKIKEEDIEVLLSIGKENIYVWEDVQGRLHENDAATRIKDAAMGSNVVFSEIKEGKISFTAEINGLYKIDKEVLKEINSVDQVIIASIHTNTPVKKGEKLAATRVIPLVIDEDKIEAVEKILKDRKLFEVVPYRKASVGIVTTGSEIYKGRIKDAFGPVIIRKFAEYGSSQIDQVIVDDDLEMIEKAISAFLEEGKDMVVCTGGMSVDPDDLTSTAIKNTGAEIVRYGAPSLPGAMFLMAYNGDREVMGLPGCVMYSKRTTFDLILPRVLAGDRITVDDIVSVGHGGLCLDCQVCRFPYCNFGK